MTKIIIETEGTEFEQNGKPYAVIDEDFREGRPIMLDQEDIEAVASIIDDSDDEEEVEETSYEEGE